MPDWILIHDEITLIVRSCIFYLPALDRVIRYSERNSATPTRYFVHTIVSINLCDTRQIIHTIFREDASKLSEKTEKRTRTLIFWDESDRGKNEKFSRRVTDSFVNTPSNFANSDISIVIGEFTFEYSIETIYIGFFIPYDLTFGIPTEYEKRLGTFEKSSLYFSYIDRTIYHLCTSPAFWTEYIMFSPSKKIHNPRYSIILDFIWKFSEYIFFRRHSMTRFALYEFAETFRVCPHFSTHVIDFLKILLTEIFRVHRFDRSYFCCIHREKNKEVRTSILSCCYISVTFSPRNVRNLLEIFL